MLDRALTTRCYFKQLGPKESLPKERKKEKHGNKGMCK